MLLSQSVFGCNFVCSRERISSEVWGWYTITFWSVGVGSDVSCPVSVRNTLVEKRRTNSRRRERMTVGAYRTMKLLCVCVCVPPVLASLDQRTTVILYQEECINVSYKEFISNSRQSPISIVADMTCVANAKVCFPYKTPLLVSFMLRIWDGLHQRNKLHSFRNLR